MWHTFWDFLWSAIVVFAFIAYLLILFNIIVDGVANAGSADIDSVPDGRQNNANC